MITTREQLKQYALRALGEPVIQVNVADIQLEDRIDEAIGYYQMYHYDGIERVYVKHQVTELDKANGYIILPDNIKGISKILSLSTNTSNSILNYETNFRMNQVANLNTASLQNYQMTMNNLQMIETLLSGQPILRFNKNDNKLYIDMNWDKLFTDQYIVIDCYACIDPEIETKMYNDVWLKSYLICLIKQQWGQNLSKYQGVQLPGGVTIDGQTMADDAMTQRANLEQQLKDESSILDIYIG